VRCAWIVASDIMSVSEDSFVTESDFSEDDDAGIPRGFDAGEISGRDGPDDDAKRDRYLILSALGAGSTGATFLCLDMERNNVPVVVKRVPKNRMRTIPRPTVDVDVSGDDDASRDVRLSSRGKGNQGGSSNPFFAEINALRLLQSVSASHANVVGLLDVVDDPLSNHFVLVLEYANRGDLRSAVLKEAAANAARDRNRPSDAPARFPAAFTLAQTWDIARDVVNALAFVHKHGIAHRDVKPENILLHDDGSDGAVAKLADFGCARFAKDPVARDRSSGNPTEPELEPDELSRRITTSMVCDDLVGTPAFMPPECAAGFAHDPFAHDCWSFGMTLFFCARGATHPAADAPNASAVLERVARMQFPLDLSFSETEDFEGGAMAARSDAAFAGIESASLFRALLTKIFQRDVSKRARIETLLTDPWLTNRGESPLTGWRALRMVQWKRAETQDDGFGKAAVSDSFDTAVDPRAGPRVSRGIASDAFAANAMQTCKSRKVFLLQPGETLFETNAIADSVFFVVEGRVEAFMRRANSISKAVLTRLVRVVGPGGFIGETAIVSGELTRKEKERRGESHEDVAPVHPVTAIATRPTRVVVVQARDFVRAWRARPSASLRRAEDEARKRLSFFREVSVKLRSGTGSLLRDDLDTVRVATEDASGSTDVDNAAAELDAADDADAELDADGDADDAGASLRYLPSLESPRLFECDAGCVIAARGEQANAAFYLIKGSVRETVSASSFEEKGDPEVSRSREPPDLATYVSGDFFAFAGAYSRRPRRATTFIAAEPCEIRFVPRGAFLNWLRRDENRDVKKRVEAAGS